MENDRTSNKKLLVARSNKRCKKCVDGCNMYQKIKNWTELPVGKLKFSKVPEKPWIYLMVDFITKLPLVAGKNMILLVCNRLSKIMHFGATTKRTLSESLARLFRDNM